MVHLVVINALKKKEIMTINKTLKRMINRSYSRILVNFSFSALIP